MYGRQPLKFYSEDLTISKILLIKHYFKFSNNDPNLIDNMNKFFKK